MKFIFNSTRELLLRNIVVTNWEQVLSIISSAYLSRARVIYQPTCATSICKSDFNFYLKIGEHRYAITNPINFPSKDKLINASTKEADKIITCLNAYLNTMVSEVIYVVDAENILFKQ